MSNIIEWNQQKSTMFDFETPQYKTENKQYTFSFVIAVYNCEKYIERTIQSIIQDARFLELCQIVLVNDGSTDSSKQICERYANQYAENILLINKENGGVSSARNAGVYYALGEYINFIDADDYFSPNVCTEVLEFEKTFGDKTDVVAIKVNLCGEKNGTSWYNKIYMRGTRLIDLWKEPHVYLNSVNNCFFNKRIKNQLAFDENLSIAEDLKVVNTVLLNKYTLGVISESTYYYNIKPDQEHSLAKDARLKKVWYSTYLHRVSIWFIDLCKKRIGYVPQFLQLTLLRDLFNRFDNNIECDKVLNESEYKEYRLLLFETVRKIDDTLFYKCDFINKDYTLYFMAKKYGIPQIEVKTKTIRFHWNNGRTNVEKQQYACIERCNISKEVITLEGYVVFNNIGIDQGNFELEMWVGNNKCHIKNIIGTTNNKIAFSGEYILFRQYFIATLNVIDIKVQSYLRIYSVYGHLKIPIYLLGYGKYCSVSPAKNTYYYNNNLLIKVDNTALEFNPASAKDKFNAESKLCKYLKDKQDIKKYHAYLLRTFYSHTKNIRPIWLISDRNMSAGDNGLAFYEYMRKKHNIKAYFVISNTSQDYWKLKKKGYNLVSPGTKKYAALFIKADCIISAFFDKMELDPFENEYLRDIISNKKYIFLQHGITKDNVSHYYSRKIQNLDMFICGANPEYNSIISTKDYFCSEKETKLTGFARYDKLVNNPKRIILVCPTWRKYLIEFTGGEPIISKQFLNSDYYMQYHALLADKKLHEFLREHKYKLCYFPHQNMIATNKYFKDIKEITVIENEDRDYSRYLSESSIMITDYSSLAFDFAYLKKPIIYLQKDKTYFFKKHTYSEGYFDYNTMGFGPIATDYKETIELIKKIIVNNANNTSQYLNRTNNFFPFNDTNNCERIYNEIITMRDLK